MHFDIDAATKELIIEEFNRFLVRKWAGVLGVRNGPGNQFFADTTLGVAVGKLWREEENLVIRMGDQELIIPIKNFLKPN